MHRILRPLHDKEHERNIWWLLVGICGLSALGWITNTQTPDNPLFLSSFFFLLFCISYSVTFFVTGVARHAVLVSVAVVGFFLLRYLSLREPLYILLLIACLVSLELNAQKR